MYINDTIISLGGMSLSTTQFAPNPYILDYCNVSVAVGQTGLTGTIVDFLYAPILYSPNQLNVIHK
jgi:hypothetical protein